MVEPTNRIVQTIGLTVALIGVFFFVSCSPKKTATISSSEVVAAPFPQAANVNSMERLDQSLPVSTLNGSPVSPVSPGEIQEWSIPVTRRKLVKKGTIAFETESINAVRRQVEDAIMVANGYIESDVEETRYDRITIQMTLRIPAQNFDGFVDKIISGVKKLDTRSINVEDVTSQWIDTESRINNQRLLEERFQQILLRANDIKTILEIERELSGVRREIERAETTLRYLSEEVAYSTLDLIVYEFLPPKAYEKTKKPTFWRKVTDGFLNGFEGLLLLIIALVTIWPFLLAVAVVTFLSIRFWKKRKRIPKKSVSES